MGERLLSATVCNDPTKGVGKNPVTCYSIGVEEGTTPLPSSHHPITKRISQMNKITTIALSALTGVATVFTPLDAKAQNVDPAHFALGQAIVSTGVQLKINPKECFASDNTAMGWYWAAKNEMVVCQENATRPNTEVNWTAEDFDTLRHEATHLVQDCMDGVQNGKLGNVYKDPIALAKAIIGESKIKAILKAYSDSTDHIKVMEFEAFSVAEMNDPAEQVKDIKNFCF